MLDKIVNGVKKEQEVPLAHASYSLQVCDIHFGNRNPCLPYQIFRLFQAVGACTASHSSKNKFSLRTIR